MDKYPKYISQEQQESFELFLKGEMSAEQQDVFKLRLSQNQQLNDSFEEFKLLFMTIEEEGLRSKLGDFHSVIEEEKPIRQLNPSKNRFNYSIAASVTILLSVGAIWFFNRHSPNEKLFHKYYTQDPGLPTVMGSNDNYDFYEAMVDYKRGNYNLAIEKWEKLKKKKPTYDTLNYYLGMAHLANGNIISATPVLEESLQTNSDALRSHVNYFLGLCYLKKGDFKNAIVFLEKSDDEKSRALLLELKD